MNSKLGRKTAIISITAALLLLAVPFANAAAYTPQGVPNPSIPVSPDPPLNSTPYYAASGDLVYSAAGAAMRDQGYGTITVTWTGTLVKAFLIWDYINPTNMALDTGSLNGNTVTGILQASDVSPCWGNGNIYVYAADVTSIVNNGANSLTAFPSGLTTGESPWDLNTIAPLDEGATLIVISQTGSTAQQVYIYTGAYTSIGTQLSSTFNHGAADGTTATTTFIVADGQLAGNTAGWNGATIDTNAFPGSDPKATSTPWSQGNLWDTKTYSVPVTLGSTSETAQVTGNGDCLTWSGQVIAIPTTVPNNPVGPITPIGAPQFGAPTLLVAAFGMLLMAVLVKRKSILKVPTTN
ncbi:MAG: hypothetical protein OK449_02795 [Thaumarchaeota archaeon]|nr:hypothetical protein [Nitrososphaerota archaeon]